MSPIAFSDDDLRSMVIRLAHAIRNPLVTIKSAAQLIEHFEAIDGEAAEWIEDIHVEVDRIDGVVRDFQRYARLEEAAAAAIAIPGAVARAVALVAEGAPELAERVMIVGGPALDVLVNQSQLECALKELLDNALRFSPPGSRVDIGWRGEELDRVAIDVEDDGPGVASDVAQNILGPFYSTSPKGTGLGLNIVNRIARLAGGELTWANPDGGGCRFTLHLPRA